MSAVHLDWRDGPPVPHAAPGSPMMRIVSVAVHVAVVLALTQVHGVRETLMETFEEPTLVFVAASPMVAPLSQPETRQLHAPAKPPEPKAQAPTQDDRSTPAVEAASAPIAAMPSLASAEFSGVGSALALGSPGFATTPSSGAQPASGGTAGGTHASSATDAGSEGSAVSAPVFDAAYLNNPRPAYPEAAVRRGLAGVVLLRVLVSTDGRAETVEVEHSSGSRILDESAIATVRSTWRFVPAKRGGLAVAASVIVPIRFELNAH